MALHPLYWNLLNQQVLYIRLLYSRRWATITLQMICFNRHKSLHYNQRSPAATIQKYKITRKNRLSAYHDNGCIITVSNNRPVCSSCANSANNHHYLLAALISSSSKWRWRSLLPLAAVQTHVCVNIPRFHCFIRSRVVRADRLSAATQRLKRLRPDVTINKRRARALWDTTVRPDA